MSRSCRRLTVAVLTAIVGGALFTGPAAAEPAGPLLDNRIRTAAQGLESLVEQYNDTREQLRDTDARSRAVADQITPLAHRVRLRQAMLGDVAAGLYRRAGQGPALALFGARSPHQFLDGVLRTHRLSTEQRRAVSDLRAAQQQVAATQLTLAALAAQQRRHEARLRVQKATVEAEISTLRRLRRQAYGEGYRLATPDTVDLPAVPYVAGPARRAVLFAYRQLGKPYRWGGSGPDGYDCSGLTSAAWAGAGVHLPHNSARQYHAVTRIDRAALRPGDLVFYYWPISHVGIYVGQGRIVHAPEYGERIRMDDVDYQPVHGYGRPA